uniref:hypothetical protein n=1 Tax=Sphingopyxis terrae TaxID=33052 RepID=UPI0036D3670A
MRITGRDGAPVAIGEIGEITVSSPSLMEGYLAADGSITPLGEGPYATDDLGYWTPEGNLVVIGRKNAVYRMGHNLYLETIERKPSTAAGP